MWQLELEFRNCFYEVAFIRKSPATELALDLDLYSIDIPNADTGGIDKVYTLFTELS